MAERIQTIFISRRRNFCKSLQVPILLIYIIAGFLVTATISTIALFVNSTRRTFVRMNVTRWERDNQNLLARLDSISGLLERAQEVFDGHIALDNRERTYMQMAYIHPDIWSMGIGGKETAPLPQAVNRNTERLINEIYESVDVLKGKYYLRKKSLEEIQAALEDNLNLWAHIPSVHPISGRNVSSGFGYRVDPINGSIRLHTGVDIGAPRGTSVHVTADGVVKSASWVSGYGLTVVVDHGFGFESAYAHCQQILVHPGDLVKRGQVIARVGSTGRSISPHLHYEVRVSGIKTNPAKYITTAEVIFD